MTDASLNDLSSNEKLQKISILAGSVTHEVRNYLAAIKINSEVLEETIKKVLKSVNAASYFITNMQLQIKCLSANKPVTEDFKQYSIAKNVQEVIELYPFVAYEKSLIIVEEGDFEYVGNPVATNNILSNLIKNSLRAIKNADKGNITIKFKPRVVYNELIIRDTATGIPQEFIPKLFELYESQMTKQGGTGIGLAFCKQTMQSYGGDITCDSVEGEYTEFVLKFPVKNKCRKNT